LPALALDGKTSAPPEPVSEARFFESYISKLHRRLRIARYLNAADENFGPQEEKCAYLLDFGGCFEILSTDFAGRRGIRESLLSVSQLVG
jgi:hypothetical protein